MGHCLSLICITFVFGPHNTVPAVTRQLLSSSHGTRINPNQIITATSLADPIHSSLSETIGTYFYPKAPYPTSPHPYIFIDDQQIKIKDPKQDQPSLITWHLVDEKFNNDLWTTAFVRAIGYLRIKTLEHFLAQVTHNTQVIKSPFYAKFGSDNPTSDLDFTYCDWTHPDDVVDVMLAFHDAFTSIYGAPSWITFDMNFYGSSGMLTQRAHRELAESSRSIAALFKKIEPRNLAATPRKGEQKDVVYVLGNYGQSQGESPTIDYPLYKKLEQFITWKLIDMKQQSLDSGAAIPSTDAKYKKSIQYSKVFLLDCGSNWKR
eukprot:749064_1